MFSMYGISRRNSPRLAAPDCHRSSWETVVTGEAWVNWLLRINEPVTTTSSTSCATAKKGHKNRADAPTSTAGLALHLRDIVILSTQNWITTQWLHSFVQLRLNN